MSTIQLRSAQLSSDQAYAECRNEWRAGDEISPNCAVTVAAWWQSSGNIGSVLAAFASGAEVDRTALLDDIAATRLAEGYFDSSGKPFTRRHMSDNDRLALDMLSTFVINYQR